MLQLAREEASLTIIQYGASRELAPSDQIVTVASAPTIIMVPWLAVDAGIELDGSFVRPVRQGGVGILSIDFTRSVGFHYLRVGRDSFAFATEDSKLRLSGVLAMLSVLRRDGLSFGRQLLFADGSSISDEHADFTWLWRWLPSIADTVEQVVQRPLLSRARRYMKSKRLGSRLDVQATIRLFRRDSSQLEKSATGFIRAHGMAFMPRSVILRSTESMTDTIENRRIVELARYCIALSKTIASISRERTGLLADSVSRLSAALESRAFARSQRPFPTEAARTPAELFDSRYAFLYERFQEIRLSRWGDPSLRLSTLGSFIKHSDEIYQAFVAVILAEALGAKRTTDDLAPRRAMAAFIGSGYELYYDTEPPAEIARTWRNETDRPDRARPDLLLFDTGSRNFLILDAKYRNDGGRASADSLREIQYYLNSFAVNRGVICYPAPVDTERTIHTLAARGQMLFELPLAPADDIVNFMRSKAVPMLRELLKA